MNKQFTRHPGYEDFKPVGVASSSTETHDESMSTMTRDEVSARLEACEARVAMSIDSIRNEISGMRKDMAASQSKLDMTVESGLSKIMLELAKERIDRYATGYKIITWTVGTVFALTGVLLALYKAFGPSS